MGLHIMKSNYILKWKRLIKYLRLQKKKSFEWDGKSVNMLGLVNITIFIS